MPIMRIDTIQIEERFRNEDGNLSLLVESIQANGLLHPIVVTENGRLIAGLRRLHACAALGWKEIPVTIVTCNDLRLAEADENRIRLDFTPSEAVAVAAYFEEEEKRKAEIREKAGKKIPSGKFPEGKKGDSRDVLAARVGMSGRTLEKAQAVVKAAEKEPEKFEEVKREMDETGKVDPAYKKVRLSKAEKIKRLDDAPLRAIQQHYMLLIDDHKKRFRAWLRTVD